MILNGGFNDLVEDIHGDITNGECGDDGTLFEKSQTGVISAVAGTDLALSTKTLSASVINMTHVIGIAVAVGETLAEYEINNGTISYNRVPKSDLAKTASDEVTMIHNFTFEVVL